MNKAKLILLLCLGITMGRINIYAAEHEKSPPPNQSNTNPSANANESIVDARREAQLSTSYAMNPHLRSFDLSVKMTGNKVILEGKVESAVEKELAEQIALGVEGIRHVDNRIVVEENYAPAKRGDAERSFNEKVEDATITATVKSKLLWNGKTHGLDINVDTTNGKVILKGNVGTTAEKELAAQIVRNTNGVISITNQLAVNPHSNKESTSKTNGTDDKTEEVPDAWITAKVKSTLLFSNNVHGLDITVTTNKGVVSLVGTVSSAAERDLAVELAKNIRGVKKVDASGLKVSA